VRRIVFSSDENEALLDLIGKGLTYDELDRHFLLATGDELSAIASDHPDGMFPVALRVLRWMSINKTGLPLLARLIARSGDQASDPRLLALRERWQQSEARVAPNPEEEILLAERRVVIDRIRLRGLLRQLRLGHLHPVIHVGGKSRTGVTRSRLLIRHVALETDIKRVEIDLEHKLSCSLEEIFTELSRLLGIMAPTAEIVREGSRPATTALQFAQLMANALANPPHNEADIRWIIFDSMDRPLLPEVREFLHALAGMRLAGQFDRCVLFLLGGEQLAVDDDDHLLASDRLTVFLSDDILHAAELLNARGTAPLPKPTLAERVQEMCLLLQTDTEAEAIEAIGSAFARLRNEVGAT